MVRVELHTGAVHPFGPDLAADVLAEFVRAKAADPFGLHAQFCCAHRRVALGSGGADAATGHIAQRADELTTIKLSDRKVQEFINEFFPVAEDLTDGQRKNNLRLQEDLKARYYNAPDLEWVGKNGWRFVNAVSDFATHADPIRKTRNYNENLFLRTAEGNPMIDKAYKMVLAAA